ncbi:MAG: type II secretion system protein [Clostridia bacterium]|nr:type II secretion system protein [Clostridia bacterium]
MREEKGITLVALVVTIIVLLILAGVTISLALSSNGIIGRAKQAENTWAKGSENEQLAMNEGINNIEKTIQDYVN